MSKPVALVTNDDGIDCYFFTRLVDALAQRFDVRVVAPAHEQSWASRAFTRFSSVTVTARDDFPGPAWAVAGTPSDCVNIALGNLLDAKPDVLVSGINLGFNVTLPLVLCSGTVAAAIEGALWGVPSLACSMALPKDLFLPVKAARGHHPDVEDAIGAAAIQATRIALSVAGEPTQRPVVHNVNFPYTVTPETPTERTVLSHMRLGSCFNAEGEDQYRFGFPSGREPVHVPEDADVNCLRRGNVSHSVLDFGRLGT